MLDKSPLSNSLHPGDGHVLPFPKKSNRKVYEKFYDEGKLPRSFYGKAYVDGLNKSGRNTLPF